MVTGGMDPVQGRAIILHPSDSLVSELSLAFFKGRLTADSSFLR